ncbi:hypothetical protein L596_014238 [Steinernema carpocapsae]|uniref:non-specific serine/threonine protein kinase n=1 Tax=Steinernema carpocapsae TaxID=34508 RepID=A0A4U5NC56_STECR|nr:hypothetical protein L596_014238 [Steinernema carpocapsae]
MTSASGKNIAAKTIPNDDRRTAGLVKKEINVMSKLSHPHIVQFLGQSLTQRSSTILMEFVGADITIVVDVMDAEEKRIIFAQLVSAVEYMHDQGFAHCDLKPDNVLVKSTVNVKICDFGGATQIKFDSIGRELPMSGMVGTRNYEAPLKIRRKPSKASKDDIWSLGLILYWLFAEDLPWRVAIKEEDEHYRRWTEDIAPPGFLCLEGEVVQVLSCTLHHVECVRPTAKELGKLPYCGPICVRFLPASPRRLLLFQ